MTAPLPVISSSQRGEDQDSLTVAKKLLIAWGCGLMSGSGLFLTILALLSWLLSGLVAFSNRADITGSQLLGVGFGLAMTLISPTLLGTFLSRSWRRGATSGLLAVAVGFGVWGVEWIGGGALSLYKLPQWLHRAFGLDVLVAENLTKFSFLALFLGLPSGASVIVVLLRCTEAFARRRLGLGVGLALGLGLSAVGGFVLGDLLRGNNVFHLIWQVPPLVWASAVYFPDLLAGRGGWKGFLLWILLILVTFGLLFVVMSLFE